MFWRDQLRTLAEEASNLGWATARASAESLRYAARSLEWQAVENRTGDGGVSKLVATAADQARPLSHSAQVGSGAQPLHTDGAHLRQPPRWVLLHAAHPSATHTLLYSLRRGIGDGRPVPRAWYSGLFLVDRGTDRFLAPLTTSRGGWRWDPGCMTPCDQRAREAAESLTTLNDAAHHYEWEQPDQVLLLDNRYVLHARSDAGEDPQRNLTRLSYSPTSSHE